VRIWNFILSSVVLAGCASKVDTLPPGQVAFLEGKSRAEIIATLGRPTREWTNTPPNGDATWWEYQGDKQCIVVRWGNAPVRDTNRVWSATVGATMEEAFRPYAQMPRQPSPSAPKHD
jgi:hypothetical protein